ncbi:MAG TPA: CPBP family intramembrane glutamic endopeptidase [Verrucomicrobiae bacterium]|nr:CPBP family intramembrane glutamic endopeptidase [Verrucomicrobiae bacterium]
MPYHPNLADWLLLAAVALTTAIDVPLTALSRRAIERGALGRLRLYAFAIASQWYTAALVAGLWLAYGRPWSALLLGPVVPWRLALAAAGAAVLVGVALRDRRQLLARPQAARLLLQRQGLGTLIPRTRRELRGWAVLSLTAGCCEELLYRGFFLALFASVVGIAGAVALSAIIFGLAHAYQGPSGVLRTTLFAVVAAAIALAGGSLIPVVAAHAAVDLIAGDALSRIASEPPLAAA